MQRLCQALRRADDAIQSYFYDGALREGAAFDDRPEQKEAEQFNRAYAERITTAILLGKKDYLTALLRDYWQDLLKAYPEGNPRCLKRAAWEQMNRQMAALKLPWDGCPQAAAAHDALTRLLTAEQVLEQLLLCGTGILELQKKSTSASPEENLREVIDKYLREHYREDISLEQLADFLHFNPSYTSDLFKRIFGKPFVSYLTSMRVETAKVLLERGKFKTYEIAEHVGYQDEKYFFKTFKKVTGLYAEGVPKAASEIEKAVRPDPLGAKDGRQDQKETNTDEHPEKNPGQAGRSLCAAGRHRVSRRQRNAGLL